MVLIGFAAQVLSTVLIMVALAMPAAPEAATLYHQTLGTNWLFFIASMTAYLVAQTWDVRIFHRIRDAILNRIAYGAAILIAALWALCLIVY